MNFTKKIIHENKFKVKNESNFLSKVDIFFSNDFVLNNNLLNFENYNGLYAPKGITMYKSIYFSYKNKYFSISSEPQNISINKYYEDSSVLKNGVFSKLNDVRHDDYYQNSNILLKNTGIRFRFKSFEVGHGNWNTWWGAGIHNSLSLSNNTLGFKHTYISLTRDIKYFKNSSIKYKYLISENFKNSIGNDFAVAFSMVNIKINKIEIGANINYLIGGYDEYRADSWFMLPLNIKNKILPNGKLSHYFVSYYNNSSNLRLFYEFGFPNKFTFSNNKYFRNENSIGTNIGFRKKKLFNNPNLVFGLEYTRLIQGIYYNLEPTPNWYQNIKYDYSSYKGRRWAAHSGTDSDDLYFYSGVIIDHFTFLFIFNYERHGVNYSFPPEIKFEGGISTSLKVNKMFFHLKYENEYYEHYGFVDNNDNIWSNTRNPGSIQRTKSLIFSVDLRIL